MSAEEDVKVVDKQIEDYWKNIESIFPRMTAEWQSTLGIWLLGPANYVIRTESLWAVDPMLRHREAEKKVLPIVKNAFAGIRFILISHLHSDHYSLPFLLEMCVPGVSIVLPDWIGEADLVALKATGASLILAHANMQLQFDGIRVDVLPGCHYDYNRPEKGVPSLAFQVTTAEKTFLFPGDVRDYEHCRMPVDCDVVFSHVWLGRGCATANREDTALDKYLHFVRALHPKLLLLTHLYDIRRLEKEQWTYKHALWIKHALQNTEIHVEAPVPGENVIIVGGNKCNEQA